MSKLEEKIDNEVMKPFMSAGHAFVCFDSVKSVDLCIKNFTVGPFAAMKLSYYSIKDKVSYAFKPYRNRNKSTFDKFEDNDLYYAEGRAEDQVLIMQTASEPVDILWKNLGGSRGVFVIRRILLNLLSIIVILFITTPTATLSTLKTVDIFNFFDTARSWTEYMPLGTFV